MNSNADKTKSSRSPRTPTCRARRLKPQTNRRKASRKRSKVKLKEKIGKKQSTKTGLSLAVQVKCSKMERIRVMNACTPVFLQLRKYSKPYPDGKFVKLLYYCRYERNEITPSFFCGCSGERQNVNQQQFVTYQRPINRRGTGTSGDYNERQINVAYIQDPTVQVGCSMGTTIPQTQQMVHLPFRDFCELLTFKLLNQL